VVQKLQQKKKGKNKTNWSWEARRCE